MRCLVFLLSFLPLLAYAQVSYTLVTKTFTRPECPQLGLCQFFARRSDIAAEPVVGMKIQRASFTSAFFVPGVSEKQAPCKFMPVCRVYSSKFLSVKAVSSPPLALCSSYIDFGYAILNGTTSQAFADPDFVFNSSYLAGGTACLPPWGFLASIQDEFVIQISVELGTAVTLDVLLLVANVKNENVVARVF